MGEGGVKMGERGRSAAREMQSIRRVRVGGGAPWPWTHDVHGAMACAESPWSSGSQGYGYVVHVQGCGSGSTFKSGSPACLQLLGQAYSSAPWHPCT